MLSPVAEKLIRYVQIDTQSNPSSSSIPSTEKQKNLSKLLVEELQQMGVSDALIDEYGYVYATIPATTSKSVPVICFCSHVDTAPDCSGTGVQPIVHENYQGQVIFLPDDSSQKIDPEKHPYLLQHIGQTVITASGTTLLGADDKAGVAIIMQLAEELMNNPSIPHGAIRLLFTPDEEVGRGADHVNIQQLGAEVGYTLDGGEIGTLEDETFSADGVVVTFHGISAHPGYAKGHLVNALKIAADFINSLPKDSWSPETTAGREGFVHPVRIEGNAEKATVEFIIRDFETDLLKQYEERLELLVKQAVANYPGSSYSFEVHEQYRNMAEVLRKQPHILAYAEEAYKMAGLSSRKEPIRGGTDGSRFSFMGLPCPNLFTGMQAIHSHQEWIGVRDMEKTVEVLVHLVQIWESKTT
ncbi:MAG: peptidase T [Hydrotalea sp.]|nr:peptidase T [Hydrotalea sp.]